MDLRPSPARWFEMVVPEEDAHDAMEALVRQGQVQFEWQGARRSDAQFDDLEALIGRYRALLETNGRHWPPPLFDTRCCTLPLDISAQRALRQIEDWRGAAAPLLDHLDELVGKQRELDLWEPLLGALPDQGLDLGALAGAGPLLKGFCLILPKTAPAPAIGGSLQVAGWLGDRQLRLGVASGEDWGGIVSDARAGSGDCIPIPPWLEGTPERCHAEIPGRLKEVARETERVQRELLRLAEAKGVARARGTLERIAWFLETARNIRCDSRSCWITGWTSATDTDQFRRALDAVGVEPSLVFVQPPKDSDPPSVIRNPAWIRPFEVFTRTVGVPGISEVDPTTWVSLLVPLLFGYMCGDIGHGAVIIAAGFLLRRHLALWPLLVFCGTAALGFGFAYGEVFGYEHLLDPLWFRPLEHPLEALLVPVAFGALVLSGGVLLHAVGTCWRGRGRHEGVADAAQLLVYWGILLALLDARWAWLCVAGATLCISNRLWTERALPALLAGIGHQIESTFSLLLNTLSFARVGAFALAHAALEMAILSIAEGVPSTTAAVVVLVAGNLIVILLEGLVVSIQTSRLVLFEFFVRFFEGSGRPFQPAAPPPMEGSQSRTG